MLDLREKLKQIPLLRKAVMAVRGLTKHSKSSYAEIVKVLEEKDRKNALDNKELIPLHKVLHQLKKAQLEKWDSFVYCDGYFYQGYRRIGISGIKPTEERVKKYEIEKYLSDTKTVLDIGSNCGFMACYLSEFVKEVDAIELNPYLIEMGKETAEFLDISNVNFVQGDFIQHDFTKRYDFVFSLSNHFTIDGNLNMDFESYIKKIFSTLNTGGVMFFESHDINGDDKDLDYKFQIASRYFTLVDYKMVTAFYPADIDKLFAIFRRLNEPGQPQKIDFKLVEAKNKYHY